MIFAKEPMKWRRSLHLICTVVKDAKNASGISYAMHNMKMILMMPLDGGFCSLNYILFDEEWVAGLGREPVIRYRWRLFCFVLFRFFFINSDEINEPWVEIEREHRTKQVMTSDVMCARRPSRYHECNDRWSSTFYSWVAVKGLNRKWTTVFAHWIDMSFSMK